MLAAVRDELCVLSARPGDDVVQVDLEAYSGPSCCESVESTRARAAETRTVQAKQRAAARIFESDGGVVLEARLARRGDPLDTTPEMRAAAHQGENASARNVDHEDGRSIQNAVVSRFDPTGWEPTDVQGYPT